MRRLILRPGAIGDCILCMPAMEFLTEGCSYSEVWVPSIVRPLITFASETRSLLSTGIDLLGLGDLPVPLRTREILSSFDSVISWYGTNRPEFREALAGIIPACTFLDALPPSDYLGHAADFFANQVGAPPGQVPHIALQAARRRLSIVIHPFSGSAKKNWPLTDFFDLANRLRRRVEWLAGPEEQLADAYRFENLAELATWLSAADLYIGNDSGITHLAAATGIPVIALFGPTNPSVWAPRGKDITVLRVPHWRDLSVDQVLHAVSRQLH